MIYLYVLLGHLEYVQEAPHAECAAPSRPQPFLFPSMNVPSKLPPGLLYRNASDAILILILPLSRALDDSHCLTENTLLHCGASDNSWQHSTSASASRSCPIPPLCAASVGADVSTLLAPSDKVTMPIQECPFRVRCGMMHVARATIFALVETVDLRRDAPLLASLLPHVQSAGSLLLQVHAVR